MAASAIRKTMRRRESRGRSRFVTFSCYQRFKLLGHPAIRDLFAAALARARAEHGFRLFAWVVMPEHVHLLVLTPDSRSLGRCLQSLKVSVAKSVLRRWKQLEAPILAGLRTEEGLRFWQPGGRL